MNAPPDAQPQDTYQPGDVVWMDLSPTVGREQAGDRPFLVLTPHQLARSRSLVIGVPLTRTDRGWVTHVRIERAEGVPGFAVCEHVRSVSVARIRRKDAPVTSAELDAVRTVVGRLIGI